MVSNIRACPFLLVAPLAGAWIEIFAIASAIFLATVAPLAGAWIEMSDNFAKTAFNTSLPLRERGLKCSVYVR